MDDITAELNLKFDLKELADQVRDGFSYIVFVYESSEILWLEWTLKNDPDETKCSFITIRLAHPMGMQGGGLSAVIFREEQAARLFLKDVKSAQQETGVQRITPSSSPELVFTAI